MAIPKLVPGFRFSPTGVELIKYFLKRKVMGKKFLNDVIAELDIYKYAPWDLPDLSYLQNGDLEWYFFCPIEKKYGNGSRMNRATEIGFWKATGKDRAVQQNNQTVGMIKTLIFHTGKAPRGDRTDWVMHEYRLEDKDLADKGIVQDSYVICKVFQKEGPGPRNGAQYGRPFNEEDWSDDEVGTPFAEPAALAPTLPVTSNSFVLNDQNLHAIGYNGSISMPCQSGLVPSPDPANSCQTGLPPSPDPANSSQIGLTPSPDPVNSCQTGFMSSPDPSNACHIGFMSSPDPSNSCQTGYMPYPDSANECQIGFMSPDPANSHQTGLVLSPPDPVNSHLTGLVPSPDPVDNSYLENQAVNTDNILSMLDMFNDNDILPEENIAEGALSTDFFDGLGDLDCLGPVGQNADFSTYGMASTGDDYLDFMELIDLDSEMFWQSAAEPKLDPK
ncbi:putative transcription factor NAM family [Medicago truncatula]|uniref:Plant NAC domain protein n=1 Tax=Medicago truncatula TaxID=3880 RepID=G7LG55_MEDTR|nr:NAC domain-containing protein 82-like [Medicago truncatula]AET03169.2 plant NAC domain protein [Medicago truncatula]RHN41316.1 putative transcription factor NAM family [Medicago truncatula]